MQDKEGEGALLRIFAYRSLSKNVENDARFSCFFFSQPPPNVWFFWKGKNNIPFKETSNATIDYPLLGDYIFDLREQKKK